MKDFFALQNSVNSKLLDKYSTIKEDDFIIKEIQKLKEVQKLNEEKLLAALKSNVGIQKENERLRKEILTLKEELKKEKKENNINNSNINEKQIKEENINLKDKLMKLINENIVLKTYKEYKLKYESLLQKKDGNINSNYNLENITETKEKLLAALKSNVGIQKEHEPPVTTTDNNNAPTTDKKEEVKKEEPKEKPPEKNKKTRKKKKLMN